MKKIWLSMTTLLSLVVYVNAQNEAPFWSLSGNSNVEINSKLGTTNNRSLRFYTNDKQRMIINSAEGYVGIGIATPLNLLTLKGPGSTPTGQWAAGNTLFSGLGENSTGNSDLVLGMASDSGKARAVILGKRSRGTLAAPLRIKNGDYISSIVAGGYDGVDFQYGASIDFIAENVFVGGRIPTRISLSTGYSKATSLERLTVSSTGRFNFNNDKIVFQPSGFVGIGTTAPENKLEIKTINNAWGMVHRNDNVKIGTFVTSGGGWLATQSNSNLYFCTDLLKTNFTAQMTLLTNGRVGIGTINPQTKLEVQTGDNSWGILNTNGSGVRVGTYTGSGGGWLATQSNSNLYFCTGLLSTNFSAQMALLTNGNFGIGTLNPLYKLSVNGTVQAKELRVETGWADYVFEKDYKLRSLSEVENFILTNKHLPEVTPGHMIESEGLEVGKISSQMIKKIEELTLYIIEQEKSINKLKVQNEKLEIKLDLLAAKGGK